MRACSFIAAVLLAGCGLTLDLDPPDPDAGPFDAGARSDAAVGMDAAIDAGSDGGGGTLDGAAPDAPEEIDATPPVDATVLDASTLCPMVPGGCYTNAECGDGSYCERPAGQCLGVGTCRSDDPTCPAEPVCGCDGQTWGSPCLAARAGISVAYGGPCRGDTAGNDDWCTASTTPRRDNRPCPSDLSVCFDDDDCGGVFPVCLGASGCDPGDEGICWGNPGSGRCYRDIDCSAGETCSGADINLVLGMLAPGVCVRP